MSWRSSRTIVFSCGNCSISVWQNKNSNTYLHSVSWALDPWGRWIQWVAIRQVTSWRFSLRTNAHGRLALASSSLTGLVCLYICQLVTVFHHVYILRSSWNLHQSFILHSYLQHVWVGQGIRVVLSFMSCQACGSMPIWRIGFSMSRSHGLLILSHVQAYLADSHHMWYKCNKGNGVTNTISRSKAQCQCHTGCSMFFHVRYVTSINQSIFPLCRVHNPFGTQCISHTFLHVGIDFRFHSTVYSLI